MAITPAQRTTALGVLLQNYGSDTTLNTLIPGLTSAAMLADLVNSIGITFDAALTTCLNTLVAQTQANITATQAAITQMQAQITADTVT